MLYKDREGIHPIASLSDNSTEMNLLSDQTYSNT